MSKIVDDIEQVVEQLRSFEEAKVPMGLAEIFSLRRQLQAAQHDYIKQGERLRITKKFELQCEHCLKPQLREDDYYLHLRKQHNLPDATAAKQAREPRVKYETGLQNLKSALSEFTDVLMEEDGY